MKKKNIKIKRIIIPIILLFILIIINLITLYCTPQGSARRMLKYINSNQVKNDVMPIGNTSAWYSEYNGGINSSVIDKSAYYFATTLVPEYYKISDSKTYYKKHKKEIKILLGITNYEWFDSIVKNIKTLNNDNLEFEEYFIVDNSTKSEGNKLETIIGIQYKENKVLLFNLKIDEEVKKGKTPVVYSTSRIEDYEVERNNEEIEKNSNSEGHTGKVIN